MIFRVEIGDYEIYVLLLVLQTKSTMDHWILKENSPMKMIQDTRKYH